MAAPAKALALPAHARGVVQQFQRRPRPLCGAAASRIADFSASKRPWGQRRGCATRAGAPASGGSGGSGGFFSREEMFASPETLELIRRGCETLDERQLWEAMPSGGEVYFFTIFEGPEGPEEERGVRLDRQFVDYTRPESCKGLVGGEEVVIREPSIQVLFRQALSTSTTQTLHGDVPGGGFTRRHLLACVQDVYTRIYEEEEAASPVPDRSGRPLLNRPTTHGPWGIWGHDLGDLLLWRMKKLGAEAPG